MEKKRLKNRIKEGEKLKKEFESGKEYQDFRALQGFLYAEDIRLFLLFKINKNLERITDDLEMDSVLDSITDELSLIREYIEKDKTLERIADSLDQFNITLGNLANFIANKK